MLDMIMQQNTTIKPLNQNKMTAKLKKQEGIGFQTIDSSDYYLTLNEKIYHTNPLTLGMLIIEGKGGGVLSYKNCHEIKLTNPNSNEWDVEIEMESNLHIGEVADDSYPKGFPTQKPKLDADGCLILKHKSE